MAGKNTTTVIIPSDDKRLADKISRHIQKEEHMGFVSFSSVVRRALRSLAKELGIIE